MQAFEGDELVDNVVRFLIDTQMTADINSMKNYFFEDACGKYGVSCTRNIGVLYERGFNLGLSDQIDSRDDDDGEEAAASKITITEVDDPVDKIWWWIENHPQIDQSEVSTSQQSRL